ncbi:hypothetical protein [Nocardia sp. CA-135398]|uniref:hypothetical protein n=1 Tax=Nocardia sp. CA-135398 TaxID=3239977 RepID=UPI003D99D6BB
MTVSETSAFVKGVHYVKLAGLLGDSLSTLSGPIHRERRRPVQAAFQHRLVDRQGAMMQQATQRLIADWRPGDLIDAPVERLNSSLVDSK